MAVSIYDPDLYGPSGPPVDWEARVMAVPAKPRVFQDTHQGRSEWWVEYGPDDDARLVHFDTWTAALMYANEMSALDTLRQAP